ncbi:transmembrane protein 238a isoform X1 [Pygocentrus nattereri]|uniref:transmembrane protein 238a isoform X1 n=2 Tax=Pygocentrus nattereri TaxID=42514 RepID=UPI000814A1D3|nr:transmembrane protein 238a isoform X1 [Pygocentrus nattereri]
MVTEVPSGLDSESCSLSTGFTQVAMSTQHEGLVYCKFALVFAVLTDLLGITSVLIGVFAPLEVKGRDFGDLLVYSGALLVLLSMAGWVMWYSGNIEGLRSANVLSDLKAGAVDRLARSLSQRIRKSRRGHATA